MENIQITHVQYHMRTPFGEVTIHFNVLGNTYNIDRPVKGHYRIGIIGDMGIKNNGAYCAARAMDIASHITKEEYDSPTIVDTI